MLELSTFQVRVATLVQKVFYFYVCLVPVFNPQMEMRLKSAEVKHNEDKLQLHKRHELAMKQVRLLVG